MESFGIILCINDALGKIALFRREKQVLDDPHLSGWAKYLQRLKKPCHYLQVVHTVNTCSAPGRRCTPVQG